VEEAAIGFKNITTQKILALPLPLKAGNTIHV
jgi:hypothetical protein